MNLRSLHVRPTLQPTRMTAAYRASRPNLAAFAGKRILIVDDEAMLRGAIAEYFRHFGGIALEAARTSDAVFIVRRQIEIFQPVHLMILDYHLKMDTGVQALQRLREIDPQVPAVLTSANPPQEILKDPRKFGFLSVLQKDIHLSEKLALLANLLGQRP